jgi:hypothetical protein
VKSKANRVARSRAHELLRQGKIVKPKQCSYCGKIPKPIHYIMGNGRSGSKSTLEMHHPDYSKPAWITWLCSKCHHKMHGQNMVGQEYIEPYP